MDIPESCVFCAFKHDGVAPALAAPWEEAA